MYATRTYFFYVDVDMCFLAMNHTLDLLRFPVYFLLPRSNIGIIYSREYRVYQKRCPEYKIASKLNICKITDTTNNQRLI